MNPFAFKNTLSFHKRGNKQNNKTFFRKQVRTVEDGRKITQNVLGEHKVITTEQ